MPSQLEKFDPSEGSSLNHEEKQIFESVFGQYKSRDDLSSEYITHSFPKLDDSKNLNDSKDQKEEVLSDSSLPYQTFDDRQEDSIQSDDSETSNELDESEKLKDVNDLSPVIELEESKKSKKSTGFRIDRKSVV